jgi:DNA replication protein DnaC
VCCSCAPANSSSACRSPRREFSLESAIAKLDKYHLLIVDDNAYVSKDQAETSVLFELIGSRYERRSLLILPISRSANGARSSPTKP